MCALSGPGPRQLTSAGKLPLAWGSPPSPLCLNYSGRLAVGTEPGAPHPDLPQGFSLVSASGLLNASFMQSMLRQGPVLRSLSAVKEGPWWPPQAQERPSG